jgi:uncharacterized protein (TIGR02246 family)
MFMSLHYLRDESATEHEQSVSSRTSNGSAERPNGTESVPPYRKSELRPDSTAQELTRAWNQGRAEDIAEMFAPDAVLILFDGAQVQSRRQIEDTIAEKSAGLRKNTTLTHSVADVYEADAERATVKGTYQLEDIKILGLTKATTGSYVLHQVKRDGRWLIARAEVSRGSEQ